MTRNMRYRTSALHKKQNPKQAVQARRVRSVRRKTRTGLFKFAIAFVLVAAAVCVILVNHKNVTNAEESGNAIQLEKYYKTITVQQGDTLWSIAKEYKSGDYRTVQDYVKELKTMNNLGSDTIAAGNKLVVAYFEEAR